MIRFDVAMKNEELVNQLRRTDVEIATYTDNISFLLSHNASDASIVDSPAIKAYQEKQIATKMKYEELKRQAERECLPAELLDQHQYRWSVNFASSTMTVEVYCDCGKKIIEDCGIDFVEVGDSN